MGEANAPGPAMSFRAEKLSPRIDVALDQMAAEARRRSNRALEVDARAGVQPAKCRTIQSLARYVCGKGVLLYIERRQTNAVDGNRITVACVFGDEAGSNHDACVLAARLDAFNPAELFNDSSKHK